MTLSPFERIGRICDAIAKAFMLSLICIVMGMIPATIFGAVAFFVFGGIPAGVAAVIGFLLGIPITVGILREEKRKKAAKVSPE